jgi:rhodanese-related sulfurtransferase
MQANEIGWFQVQNLIKAKIPFLIVQIDCDLQKLFTVIDNIHIRNWSINLSTETTTDLIQEVKIQMQARSANTDFPVLVVCNDGNASKKMTTQLGSELGFLNAYTVPGGFSKLLADRTGAEV